MGMLGAMKRSKGDSKAKYLDEKIFIYESWIYLRRDEKHNHSWTEAFLTSFCTPSLCLYVFKTTDSGNAQIIRLLDSLF
jgi:hypothetical protein